ncbi:MAG: hypothetical protein KF864_00025 [Phycisphaeraceae bacterium]|nr:hypothetical protein [Phycisphaeraceae bacterium]
MALRHAARKAWWMLVDGGGDVVAMCERVASGSTAYAAVSAQWTYDAYGAVIDEEVFDAASPVNRAGHKGLFADRLDVGVVDEWGHENCRLIPGAELAFYNRNRTYSPYLGRFLQSDPNATGVVISSTPTFQGDGAASGLSAFDFELLYGNDHNTYQYLGSSTWTRDDPTGLSWSDGFDMLAGAGQFALGASDPGGLIGSMYSALIEQYSANLDYDVDWAVDLTQGDDWHTRTSNQWVTVALVLATTEHFGIEIDGFDEGPSGPAMGSAAKRVAAGLAKAGGKIKGLVRKNIAEMILKKANEIDPFGKGKNLTHAGKAFDKHKSAVMQALGSGVKYGGNAATKNKIGQQFVEKMMKTGIAVKRSKTQVVFWDPNLRDIGVKASFDNSGKIFKVDFYGPR